MRRDKPRLRIRDLMTGTLGAALLAVSAGATAATVASAASGPGDPAHEWPLNGRTFGETRFSPLTQINPANAGSLGLAWEFSGYTPRGRVHRGNEAAPVVSDGVMYVSGPWSMVYALDARSGKLLWQFDPKVDG